METDRAKLAEDLLSFAQLAPRAVSEQVLLEELLLRIRKHGVTNVVAGVMSDSKRNFKLGPRYGIPNAAWLETYLEEQLYKNDPSIAFALRGVRGVYWDQAFSKDKLSRGGQKVISVAESYGLGDGFMTPVPLLSGDVVIVAFQGERLNHDPDVEAVLRGLAGYYGTEGHRLAVKSQLKSAEFAALTMRQLQVLHLAALGCKNSEIADELEISEATVSFHLAGARARLGAKNTKEALALIHATPRDFFTE